MSDNSTPPSFYGPLSEGSNRLRTQYMGAVSHVVADALKLADGDTSRVETVTKWPAHALVESHVTVDGKPFGPVVRLTFDGVRAYVTVEYAEADK